MKNTAVNRIDELVERYPALVVNKDAILKAVELIVAAYTSGNKILVCGNGGSAADSLHIVGELMKAFVKKRKVSDFWKDKLSNCEHSDYMIENLQMALPAISLVSEAGLLTAYANDVAPDMNFAQQVFGQGKAGDVLLAISTSGNSANVIYASEVARAMDVKVISLTGSSGGALKEKSDILINVPEDETFKIQELHLPVYHAMCLAIEEEFFGE
ncbi:putative phosphoheptose isomerase [Selenomonas ruminantium subsp. lactilytica TAM6421]|uniref:Putative phosphoheptose isomerase n=1 Tax=Selenomonas ruminantium subsp. lactilytica (strain NBRC 103574 / TAM6421) TaxID=927704 RepID=I0GNF3_SELRL|nr:SIS domain-containing protein [Selenomonas ruminantium]BAL82290.1 putative phosphoheptose isomerase [Selenomonas ruminantium subsp. lactilytica TAM6421]